MISDGELKVSVSDVQVIGHAQLKEELAVGITLANTMSSQDTVPGRLISTNSGIKIDKDDELVCLRYSVHYRSEFRIELFFIFVRVLHGWSIGTY